MRYGFYCPTRGGCATGEAIEAILAKGEALGFTSTMIADHIVFPRAWAHPRRHRWLRLSHDISPLQPPRATARDPPIVAQNRCRPGRHLFARLGLGNRGGPPQRVDTGDPMVPLGQWALGLSKWPAWGQELKRDWVLSRPSVSRVTTASAASPTWNGISARSVLE